MTHFADNHHLSNIDHAAVMERARAERARYLAQGFRRLFRR